MRRRLVLATAALAALSTAGPAPALDDTKPTAPCGQHINARPGAEPKNLDLTGGFFKYEAARNDEATTVNLIVNDLNTTVPEGATFISWNLNWAGGDGVNRFVRALADFSGIVVYEYGQIEDGGAVTVARPLGNTPGKLFEGKDGVVQLVIPADPDGKAGAQLTAPSAVTYTGAPGVAAAPTPTRGPLTQVDGGAGKTWKVAACPEAPATQAPPDPGSAPAPSTDPPSEAPLPVKVVTRKAKAGRRLSVRLRSSEPLTQLTAQLVKGKKVVGKGKLARLSGKGKLRLKLTRKPRRGLYRLDIAGTDSAGARRFASAKLRLR